MRRTSLLRIPLTVNERASIEAEAMSRHLPAATWARAVLLSAAQGHYGALGGPMPGLARQRPSDDLSARLEHMGAQLDALSTLPEDVQREALLARLAENGVVDGEE